MKFHSFNDRNSGNTWLTKQSLQLMLCLRRCVIVLELLISKNCLLFLLLLEFNNPWASIIYFLGPLSKLIKCLTNEYNPYRTFEMQRVQGYRSLDQLLECLWLQIFSILLMTFLVLRSQRKHSCITVVSGYPFLRSSDMCLLVGWRKWKRKIRNVSALTIWI